MGIALLLQVLDQLEEMHGTLRARLQATNSASQRALAAAGGHLDFLTSLRGLYGARCGATVAQFGDLDVSPRS